MPIDPQTAQFYAREAARYAARPNKDGSAGKLLSHRHSFISALPEGAHVLDLGCGGGRDSLAFRQAGFEVTAIDASAEMAAIAAAHIGQHVSVCSAQDIAFAERFDGIWASASLLHVPSDDIPDTFRRVHHSLKSGGLFTASFKEAEEDWRDAAGRYFCAMTESMLRAYLSDAGFTVQTIECHSGYGSDGAPTNWLWTFAGSE